jgi:hypothetical protein
MASHNLQARRSGGLRQESWALSDTVRFRYRGFHRGVRLGLFEGLTMGGGGEKNSGHDEGHCLSRSGG